MYRYYGDTLAETVLGKAMKTMPIPRESFVVSTKCGRYGSGFDFSAERVTHSVDESLERLNLDYVDIILCHDIEFGSLDQVPNFSSFLPLFEESYYSVAMNWVTCEWSRLMAGSHDGLGKFGCCGYQLLPINTSEGVFFLCYLGEIIQYNLGVQVVPLKHAA